MRERSTNNSDQTAVQTLRYNTTAGHTLQDRRLDLLFYICLHMYTLIVNIKMFYSNTTTKTVTYPLLINRPVWPSQLL
jgi:hypothetical protein